MFRWALGCTVSFALFSVVACHQVHAQVDYDMLRASLSKVSKKDASDQDRKMAASMYIALGEYGDAYFMLKEIPPNRRDAYTRALFYEIFSHLDMQEEAQKELEEITASARTGKALGLPKALFAKKISGFGVYTPFGDDRFSPGQRVLVYTEVDNFTRVQAVEGWKILLKVGIVISTELGDPLYRNDEFSTVNFTPRSPARDLWLTSRLNIPRGVRAGKRYTLTITVTDETSGSKISKSIPFIGAPE